MPFTKKDCLKVSKIKIKLRSHDTLSKKKEIKICCLIYQCFSTVYIIRRYYCLNRDVIGQHAFYPVLRLWLVSVFQMVVISRLVLVVYSNVLEVVGIVSLLYTFSLFVCDFVISLSH